MQIPTQIKVGGIKYKVKIVEPGEMDDRTGAKISTDKCLIKVLKAEPAFMHQAFLHELFHAINMEFEETIIEFLSQSMYQIVADNPQLFEREVNKHEKRSK